MSINLQHVHNSYISHTSDMYNMLITRIVMGSIGLLVVSLRKN